MKFLITENKFMDGMKYYLLDRYEILSKPLEVDTTLFKGKYTVIFDGDDTKYNYNYYEKRYKSDDGKIWFKEYSNNHPYTNCRWEVSDELEFMYNMFGEHFFEVFVKDYFGLNITDKSNHEHNWIFV